MNLYFLVEGRRTEQKIYRHWLTYLLPDLIEVDGFSEVEQNNYFLRGARHKSPSFQKRLKASILEVNQSAYDYLIICIDAEERTVEETRQGIIQILVELEISGVKLKDNVYFEIVVQNKCIETWFLGNRRMISHDPQDHDLVEYIRYFDVAIDDPELMTRPAHDNRFRTAAQFHLDYLKKIFVEMNLSYSKTRPRHVIEAYYLAQLQNRIQETDHLNSFRYLCNLCERINHTLASV